MVNSRIVFKKIIVSLYGLLDSFFIEGVFPCMTDIRTYSVAGFCFVLEAESSLLERMQNLRPFHVLAPVSMEDTIFWLKVGYDNLFAAETNSKPTCCVCPSPESPQIDIFNESGCWRFFFHVRSDRQVAAELICDNDFRQGHLFLDGVSDKFGLNMAVKLMFTFATALSGAVETHASAVVHGGIGYVFLGFSGTGKSTHSQLWIENIPGTELLNDDFPVMRLLPDGSVRVFGSPWSGKTKCYKCEDAPVGAIVWLRQGKENRIGPLSPVDAYAALFSSTSEFRPVTSLADGWHRTLEGICSSVPFYVLDCLPDSSAAALCFQTVHTQTYN